MPTISTGRHRRTLEGHEKGVRSLAYNEDYRFLISGGFDYDALVWNPYVERLILRLHGHTAPLCGVEVIPDTPQIITADVSGVVKVWDIRTFACVQTFSKEDEGDIAKISSVVTLPKKQRTTTGTETTAGTETDTPKRPPKPHFHFMAGGMCPP